MTNPPSAPLPDITFADFTKLDVRVARVVQAPLAEGTRAPCREILLDLGPLGQKRSVGQYALLDEADLVGKLVAACINLGTRKMGRYVSEALVLGAPHPKSPPDQSQATPLWLVDANPGDRVF